MAMLDLRPQAREAAFELPHDLGLSDEDRQLALVDWRARMVTEHLSARVFAGLLPQMMRVGIDPQHQTAVVDMIGQELRHGRLCAAVVRALGEEPIVELPEILDVPRHADAPPLEALLRNLITVSCLNETVAVAVIAAGRESAGPEPIRAIMTEILADEVGHARFGWRLLEELGPRLDDRLRERLGQYLVPAFRQLAERHYLGDQETASDLACTIGVCDARDTSELFLGTVSQVIVPGLEGYGLPATAAWRYAMEQRAAG